MPAGRASVHEEIPMARAKITGFLLGVLAVASAGCQGKPQFAPVEGTVTKGGKPLAGVTVDFYPDPGNRGPRSTSEPTDEAGHYRLHSTWGGDEGAVVGPHRVCIFDSRDEMRRNFLDRLPKKPTNTKEVQEKLKEVEVDVRHLKIEASAGSRVPASYGRPTETPLQVEVQPGAQVIDLEVK
jgi:hypothetical protein